MKKHLIKTIAVLLAVLLSLLAVPGLRMIFLFPFFDQHFDKNSVARELGFELTMPLQSSSMLPVLLTYNDSERASKALHMPVSFTVDYTFSRPSFFLGRSHVMDPDESLYSSFAGAYWVSGTGHPLALEELALLVEFDVNKLMLPSFGLSSSEAVFEKKHVVKSGSPVMIRSDVFMKYTGSYIMSTPLHPRNFQLSYLLYGIPPKSFEFYPVQSMYGVLLQHYYPDEDLNLILYALASSEDTVQSLEETLLKKVQIERNAH